MLIDPFEPFEAVASSPEENRALLARMLREKARLSRSFPLSYAQESLWFLDQLAPGNPFYNVSKAVRMSGIVDVEVLERTLREVIRRHEILRTHFRLEDDQRVQIITAPEPFVLHVEDVSTLPEQQRDAEAERLSLEAANRAFDLSRGPLLRALLIKLGDDDYLVVLSMHHIITDGWSMGILVREISTIYQAFVEGKPSPFEDLTIQYADFVEWQRERAPLFEKDLEYWRQQLADAPPIFSLPTDRPRPPVQSFRGASCSFRLSAELSGQLRELCRRESVTLFMLLLAAFKVLLFRYTGQTDVIVGTDISGRERKEVESLIGFFVNQLVFRTKVEPGWSFTQLVQAVREVCLGAYAHQEVPFERVVEEMNVERSLSHEPLFQVLFKLSNAPRQTLELSDVKLKAFDLKDETAKTDLTLAMCEVGEQLLGDFQYYTDLFDASTIDRFSRHFQNLLATIVRMPEEQIGRLPLFDEQEVQLWSAAA